MMEGINIFEVAAKAKIRYDVAGLGLKVTGKLTVEDLYGLRVEELDKIFKSLNADAKVAQEESLLATKSTEDTILEVKIAIIRHIVAEKLAEAQAKVSEREKKARNERIKEIIALKKEENLHSMSIEDLEKMLQE